MFIALHLNINLVSGQNLPFITAQTTRPPKMFIAHLMLSYQLSPNVPGLGQELMGNVKVRPNYYRPATCQDLEHGCEFMHELG